MGFLTAQGSRVHTQYVCLKYKTLCRVTRVSNQMEEALEQTGQITSRRSFLGVLKVHLASEFTIKGKNSCNIALFGQNVSCTFWSYSCFICIFLSTIGNFLLNNGVDISYLNNGQI